MPNVYEIITERILEHLKRGLVPWRMPWATEAPQNLASGHTYRGVNVFLLSAMRFSSPYWVTYKQAEEKGGQVRKGEKGTPIIFWKRYQNESAPEGDRDRFVLRYYTVFNALQCDRLEVPSSAAVPFNKIEACEKVVAGYPMAPRYDFTREKAAYSPSEDRIIMPAADSFESPESFYSTLFHEMTHSTGHKDRLARKGVTDPIHFGSHDYSLEELIAECGAAFLCGHTGIINRTIDNSAAYIAHWSAKLKSEPDWIVKAGSAAAKASDHILGTKPATSEG